MHKDTNQRSELTMKELYLLAEDFSNGAALPDLTAREIEKLQYAIIALQEGTLSKLRDLLWAVTDGKGSITAP